MKAESSTGLSTIGSLTLCRSLLAAGLVDRFRVVMFPVITGSIQLVEYVPTLLSGPPGSGQPA